MENKNYIFNFINCCYFCKSELYDIFKFLVLKRGYFYVLDGVNVDDLWDYCFGI